MINTSRITNTFTSVVHKSITDDTSIERRLALMVYTINQIRDIVNPIAASYGVRSLLLFGSYARGEATDDSDIDLLLDRTGMAKGWTIGGLYADLTDALGKDLDLVTTTGANDGFLSRIQSNTVILYQRSLDQAV